MPPQREPTPFETLGFEQPGPFEPTQFEPTQFEPTQFEPTQFEPKPAVPTPAESIPPLAIPPEPAPFDPVLEGSASLNAEPPHAAMPWEPTPVAEVVPDAPTGPMTQAVSWEQLNAADEPASTATPQATELLASPMPAGHDATVALGADEASTLDALFGEAQFREYEGILPERVVQTGVGEQVAPARRNPNTQKTLFWIAGGMLVVLSLIALFLLGSRLGIAALPAPLPVSTTPVEPEEPGPLPAFGPVEPGEYDWDELLGGECLAPFTSPWSEEFTVVACDEEHDAQMIRRAEFPEATVPDYLTAEEFKTQLSTLCAAPDVLNYEVAGTVNDIQVSGSYPPTIGEWALGNRTYYCFITRASGEPLVGDLAIAPPEPVVEEDPAAEEG